MGRGVSTTELWMFILKQVPLIAWAEGLSLSSLKKNGVIWLDTDVSFPEAPLWGVRLRVWFGEELEAENLF